ncbi:LOW QUALITY PROTEIN: hypothetical protein OSB04_018005 [Centaurea solstitialis]|uniref:Cytochrome P450 n=1 Tax=Centaurea solstitialis TaxID=347529 RepID=A0AA38TFT3_9ASTR|nr:LOW QUALITY PROTEIN: hypothetical protein OSB04_018005 [Centaurea solstitialis]
MAFLEYFFILFLLLILFSFSIFIHRRPQNHKKTVVPTNWPIVGMIPGVLVNIHRFHDFVTEGLIEVGGTRMVFGPCFANMDMLVTADPANIHHILSKNCSTYPKGDKYSKIFAIFGDGIINSDGKLWEFNRKITMSIFKHPSFQSSLERITWNEVKNGLLPVLESTCERDTEVNLQDIFKRFSFDTICTLLFDNNPKSLSLNLPDIPCLKALSYVTEAIMLRHVIPSSLWKLLQLLRVGKEKKLDDAWKTLDQFIYKCLAQNQNEYNDINSTQHQEGKFTLFTALMREVEDQIDASWDRTKFLRDTSFNLLFAGMDTTSIALAWFIYILAKNPNVEDKILDEIHTHLDSKVGERWNVKELNGMVYLHGALCESLRLFPPIPFNHKSPSQPDILPTGDKVDQNTKIIISMYSMGRMKSIWGEDCMEFKPERWILGSEGIKHEPSYKFAAFGAGPRTCVAKNMALSQLKILSATILYHYHIELVEGHPVLPIASMVLEMKHGLKTAYHDRSTSNETKRQNQGREPRDPCRGLTHTRHRRSTPRGCHCDLTHGLSHTINAHLKSLEKASENLKLFKADLLDYESLRATIAGCNGFHPVLYQILRQDSLSYASTFTNLVNDVWKLYNYSSSLTLQVELIEPAVKGTLNVFKACCEVNVKKVVHVPSLLLRSYLANRPKDRPLDECHYSLSLRCNNYIFLKPSAIFAVDIYFCYGVSSTILTLKPLSSVAFCICTEGYEELENRQRLIVDVRLFSRSTAFSV